MDHNFLYKYRSIENINRDLKCLEENYFWASKIEELNDEQECLYNSKTLREKINVLCALFPNCKESINRVNEAFSTLERSIKNIGILKSLGAKDKDIYKIFSYEAIIIASLAFILSIPLWQMACNLSNKLFFSDEAYVGGLEINILSPLVT